MPINPGLISSWPEAKEVKSSPQLFPDIPQGTLLTLTAEVISTVPDRKTYPSGSTGRVRKSYRTKNSNGVILRMEDDRKIPVTLDRLSLGGQPIQIPPPYSAKI
ncbi:MAG: hypothetical protein Q7R93_01290 [bacterium]|nr:hypothetical protein [bacterium]